MIEQTLKQLQEKVQSSQSLDDKGKSQVLELLDELKHEVEELSDTHRERAESIATYTKDSTDELLSVPLDSQSLEHSLRGLNSSIEEFEGSHPKLISTVNAFCTRLSSLGL